MPARAYITLGSYNFQVMRDRWEPVDSNGIVVNMTIDGKTRAQVFATDRRWVFDVLVKDSTYSQGGVSFGSLSHLKTMYSNGFTTTFVDHYGNTYANGVYFEDVFQPQLIAGRPGIDAVYVVTVNLRERVL